MSVALGVSQSSVLRNRFGKSSRPPTEIGDSPRRNVGIPDVREDRIGHRCPGGGWHDTTAARPRLHSAAVGRVFGARRRGRPSERGGPPRPTGQQDRRRGSRPRVPVIGGCSIRATEPLTVPETPTVVRWGIETRLFAQPVGFHSARSSGITSVEFSLYRLSRSTAHARTVEFRLST